MKTLKLAAFAIALGFFAASCGNTETTETTDVDTTIIEAPVETQPAPVEEPVTVDTTTTTPAPAAEGTDAPAPEAH